MAEKRDRELVKSTEPSRSEAMTPSATSRPHYGSHRLRQLAASGLGEAGAMQAAVTRMMRTEPEDPRTRPTPHVVDLSDVTRGLGLEQSDESRVQQLVGSSIPAFTQKTQTQRIVHARGRLTSTMRDSLKHVDADKRDEISRRAMAYWRRNYQTDYGKEPTVRYQGARAVEKSMSAPIPVLPLANLYDRLVDAKRTVLEKGEARGGKYYRRIPTGNPKRPWRYFYHAADYEQYVREQHASGAEAAAAHVQAEPPAARPKPAQQQLGFDFGAAPAKPAAPPPTKHPEPAIIPLWLENRRRDALAAIEAGNEHRMKVMLDGSKTVSEALEGPGADRGRKWLLEHVITPLSDALAKLAGPKLVVPTHGRPEAQHAGLEVTGVPEHAPASSAFRSQAGTTERAVEHAEKLAELLRAKGLKYVNVWSKPGVGTRVYLPARQYLAIGQDGSVSTVVNGRQTYDPGALWPQHRSVVEEARAEHRTWHGERLAAESPAAEEAAAKPAPVVAPPAPAAPKPPDGAPKTEGSGWRKLTLDEIERLRDGQAEPGPPGYTDWLTEVVAADGSGARIYFAQDKSTGKTIWRRDGRIFTKLREAKEAKPSAPGTAPPVVRPEPEHASGPSGPSGTSTSKRLSLEAVWKLPVGALVVTKDGTKAYRRVAPGKMGWEPQKPHAASPDGWTRRDDANGRAFDTFTDLLTEARDEGDGVHELRVEKPAEKPAEPKLVVPVPTTIADRPPPGGWTDADKVPQRDQEAAEARRKSREERQKKHLLTDFKVGQTLTINGKKYRVVREAYEVGQGRFGRVVGLMPAEGRATSPRELQVYPTGHAELRAGTSREEVTSLEGGTRRDTPWAPPKPEPKVVVPVVPASPTPPPGTPRHEAKATTERMKEEGEYVNDRASKIEQRGEDVLGSARHKAATWKSLRDALVSEHADTMFTRDFLIRQEPVDFIGHVQSASGLGTGQQMTVALNALGAHLALRKFGAKPEIARRSSYHYEGDKLTRGWTAEGQEVSAEEHTKRQRESYYRAYAAVREVLDQYADRREAQNVSDLARAIRGVYDSHLAKYGYLDAGTEALRSMYNGTVGRGQLSVAGQLNDFARRVKQAHGSMEAGAEHVPRHAMALLEGRSFNEAFGTKTSKGGNDIDIATLYNTSKMVRSGPPSEYKNTRQGLDLLDKATGGKFQMRGVQWGKSVTDEEREHHLKSLVDSFADLTDILGLPPGMASFNGRLAIAVGARGRAGASAHYEPTEQVINLTRDSGAGALAHEWGHMFDNLLFAAAGQDTLTTSRGKRDARYASETASGESPKQDPTFNAMSALQTSDAMYQVRLRLAATFRQLKQDKMISKSADYWLSTREVFARCFEQYIQRKLEKQGRQNTYLSGLLGHGRGREMWPTTEEVDALTPHFDRLFAAFAESPLLHKAFIDLLSRPRIAPEYSSIVGGRLVVPRG